MRRIARMLVIALGFAGPAAAGGLNLSWEHCSGAGAVSNQSFACGSSAGYEILVGSFVPSVNFAAVGSIEAILEFQALSGVLLPAWLASTECSAASLVWAPLDSVLDLPCRDWDPAGGQPFTLSGLIYPLANASEGRINLSAALSSSRIKSIAMTEEGVAFRIRIPHTNLVAGGCGGCTEPVLIQFSQLKLFGSLNETLILPTFPGSNRVKWQAGGPVATRTTTFAAVKSLYR